MTNITFKGRRQYADFFNAAQRWAWIVAHRRCGKTVACIQKLIKETHDCYKPEPRFAYIAPTFTQAKDVAFSYLTRLTQPLNPKVSVSELSITFRHNNGRIRLYGADSYDRLRGIYLDGAVLDEFGDMDPRAWTEVIRPALSDRQGWATFIGTPKGRNLFYKLGQLAKNDPEWLYMMLRASETGLLPEAELADARKVMTQEQYDQEYECSFDAAIIGAYFGKELAIAEKSGRIGKVPYDPSALVHTVWDLGVGDSTAIFFYQVIGTEIHLIDYYEATGEGLPHYVQMLRLQPYMYGQHFLPHDGNNRELESGRKRVDILGNLGIQCDVLPRMNFDDSISNAKLIIPRLWIDEVNCERGLDAMRMYQSKYDDKLEALKGELHNWASHGGSAFRYLAQSLEYITMGAGDMASYQSTPPAGV